MKYSIYLIKIIAFIIGLSACNKRQELKPVQVPMTAFIKTNLIEAKIHKVGAIELGQLFSSEVKGKIVEIGCKMPEKGRYPISLWDAETQVLLQTTVITVKADTMKNLTLKAIEPVIIEPNRKYIISLNPTSEGVEKHSYFYIKPIMPFKQGSITVYECRDDLSTTPVFPIYSTNSAYLFGYPDFKFIPD